MGTQYDLNQMNAISIMKELLKETAEKKASDLHLVAGFKPALRINGNIVQIDYPVLKPDDVEKMVFFDFKRRTDKKI